MKHHVTALDDATIKMAFILILHVILDFRLGFSSGPAQIWSWCSEVGGPLTARHCWFCHGAHQDPALEGIQYEAQVEPPRTSFVNEPFFSVAAAGWPCFHFASTSILPKPICCRELLRARIQPLVGAREEPTSSRRQGQRTFCCSYQQWCWKKIAASLWIGWAFWETGKNCSDDSFSHFSSECVWGSRSAITWGTAGSAIWNKTLQY